MFLKFFYKRFGQLVPYLAISTDAHTYMQAQNTNKLFKDKEVNFS